MQKDSLDTLLLRHYGNTARVPAGLEEHVLASVRQEVKESRLEQQASARLHQRRVSRRHAFRLLAIGTARIGFDALNAGLDGLQVLETALVNQDATQKALP